MWMYGLFMQYNAYAEYIFSVLFLQKTFIITREPSVCLWNTKYFLYILFIYITSHPFTPHLKFLYSLFSRSELVNIFLFNLFSSFCYSGLCKYFPSSSLLRSSLTSISLRRKRKAYIAEGMS